MSASSNRCSKPIETSTVAIPVRLRRTGAFHSQANLSWAKGEGIVDAAFDRKGTLAIDDMVSSSWIYKQLRSFSRWHRRVHLVGQAASSGWTAAPGKGWEHFRQYVQASVVSYNLLVLASLASLD